MYALSPLNILNAPIINTVQTPPLLAGWITWFYMIRRGLGVSQTQAQNDCITYMLNAGPLQWLAQIWGTVVVQNDPTGTTLRPCTASEQTSLITSEITALLAAGTIS
jgi:hypothetical protein